MSYAFSMGTRDEQGVYLGQAERRRSTRIPFRFPVRMTVVQSQGRDNPRPAHVLGHDLSETGISLIYTKALEVGQKLELEMPGKICAAVVRCVESNERGHYLIGCQFIN